MEFSHSKLFATQVHELPIPHDETHIALVKKPPKAAIGRYAPKFREPIGQGESIEEAKQNLGDAIRLIFEDRLADLKRGFPEGAIEAVIAI